MKVTGIKTYLHRGHFNWLLVKVETDEGLVGWGEASTQSANQATRAQVHTLGENYLMGKDPRQIELHVSTMLRNTYWKPSLVFYSAISGLEIAMWDIMGKSLGVPIYALLGGACRPRLKTYHNGWWFGAKSFDDYARLAKEMADKGARALKFDPLQGMDTFIDTNQFRQVVKAIRMVREAVGEDVELMIDVHGRLSPDNAIRLALAVEEYSPYWWEEPLPTDASVDDLARVAASINIPVVAGERIYTRWGFRDLFEKRAAAIINPDIAHEGGILETKKIADMAHAYYVSFTAHSAGGPVLTAASIQVEAATPNFLIHEYFSIDAPYYGEVLRDPFPAMKNEFIELPTKPGLGIEIDESQLEKRPFKFFDIGDLWATHEEWSENTGRSQK
jgi:galactonate dehydratase